MTHNYLQDARNYAEPHEAGSEYLRSIANGVISIAESLRTMAAPDEPSEHDLDAMQAIAETLNNIRGTSEVPAETRQVLDDGAGRVNAKGHSVYFTGTEVWALTSDSPTLVTIGDDPDWLEEAARFLLDAAYTIRQGGKQ